MAFGPGRYDDETTAVREATGAHAIVVMVFNGGRGDGFEVQTDDPAFLLQLPGLLRTVATSIEGDVRADAAKIGGVW